VRAVALGPEPYARFLARLGSPLFVVLHLVAFLFVLLHAITWFNLAPAAMVVRLGGKRVPDWFIVAANYGAWVALSVAVAVVLLVAR
jgi:fumarate reductase subunit C